MADPSLQRWVGVVLQEQARQASHALLGDCWLVRRPYAHVCLLPWYTAAYTNMCHRPPGNFFTVSLFGTYTDPPLLRRLHLVWFLCHKALVPLAD